MDKNRGIFGKGLLATGLVVMAALGFTLAGSSPGAADGAIPIYQAGTISASGYYYLTQDITVGAGITIGANDVTLDLNGHKIVSTARGVYGFFYREIRVTNGVISASQEGVYLNSVPSGGLARVDHVTVLSAVSSGIRVSGAGSRAVVEHNIVTSVTNGPGIYLEYAGGGRICGNLVSGSTGNYSGMSLTYSLDNLVGDNVVNNETSSGIFLSHSDRNQITRNTTTSNGQSGIALSSSTSNSFSWNTCAGNSSYGLDFSGSTGNVYANNYWPGNTSGTVSGATGNTNGGGNFP